MTDQPVPTEQVGAPGEVPLTTTTTTITISPTGERKTETTQETHMVPAEAAVEKPATPPPPVEKPATPPPPPTPAHEAETQSAAASQARSISALLKETGVEKYAMLAHPRSHQSFDNASETSSMAERRVEAALGGPDFQGSKDTEDELAARARNVGQKLYAVGTGMQKKREERLRLSREKAILDELQKVTQRPSITGRARAKPGKGQEFPEHQFLWEDKKNERRLISAQQRELDELNSFTGSPCILEKSARIVESMPNGYKDPVTGWNEQFAKFTAKRVQVLPDTMFSPNINSNAFRPDTGVCTIYDRLYGESVARNQRQFESALKAREMELMDRHTGKPLFLPCASPTKFKPTSTDNSFNSANECHPVSDYALKSEERKRQKSGSVFDTLYNDSKDRKSRDTELKEAVCKVHTFAPAINDRSRFMTHHEQRPFYKYYTPPSKDEVTQHLSPGQRRYVQQQEEMLAQGGVVTAESQEEFHRRTERCEAVKENKLLQARRERIEREMGPCSFHPSINSKSVEIFENTHLYGTPVLAHPAPGASTPLVNPTVAGNVAVSQSPAPLDKKLFQSVSQDPQSSAAKSAMAQNVSTSFRSVTGGAAAETSVSSHPATAQSSADFITTFEKQMYAVLDEWRKLEEV